MAQLNIGLDPEMLAVLADQQQTVLDEQQDAAKVSQEFNAADETATAEVLMLQQQYSAEQQELLSHQSRLLDEAQAANARRREIDDSVMLSIAEPILGLFNENFSRSALAQKADRNLEDAQQLEMKSNISTQNLQLKMNTKQAEQSVLRARVNTETAEATTALDTLSMALQFRDQQLNVASSIVENTHDPATLDAIAAKQPELAPLVEAQKRAVADENDARRSRKMQMFMQEEQIKAHQLENVDVAKLDDATFASKYSVYQIQQEKQRREASDRNNQMMDVQFRQQYINYLKSDAPEAEIDTAKLTPDQREKVKRDRQASEQKAQESATLATSGFHTAVADINMSSAERKAAIQNTPEGGTYRYTTPNGSVAEIPINIIALAEAKYIKTQNEAMQLQSDIVLSSVDVKTELNSILTTVGYQPVTDANGNIDYKATVSNELNLSKYALTPTEQTQLTSAITKFEFAEKAGNHTAMTQIATDLQKWRTDVIDRQVNSVNGTDAVRKGVKQFLTEGRITDSKNITAIIANSAGFGTRTGNRDIDYGLSALQSAVKASGFVTWKDTERDASGKLIFIENLRNTGDKVLDYLSNADNEMVTSTTRTPEQGAEQFLYNIPMESQQDKAAVRQKYTGYLYEGVKHDALSKALVEMQKPEVAQAYQLRITDRNNPLTDTEKLIFLQQNGIDIATLMGQVNKILPTVVAQRTSTSQNQFLADAFLRRFINPIDPYGALAHTSANELNSAYHELRKQTEMQK